MGIDGGHATWAVRRLPPVYHEKKRGLGRVLDKKLATDIFTDGQTIKNKGGLCEFAVAFMRDSDDWALTPEGSRLCESLLDFIRKANGMPHA